MQSGIILTCTDDFDYYLPEQCISQFPKEPRDSCRLLQLDRANGHVSHHVFSDLPELFRTGDRLIFNDTRVIPARIYGTKANGVRVEILFTERIDSCTWKAIVKPGKRLPEGTVVFPEQQQLPGCSLRIDKVLLNGDRIVTAAHGANKVSLDDILETSGHIPLPPYITRRDTKKDREDYQTVYSQNLGAVAAPTAGLHFTENLIESLKRHGIDISFLTLHVGIGTFRPVKEADPKNHPIHEEPFDLPECTAVQINQTRLRGGRVIAVGTTVVRVLEHCSRDGLLKAERGSTRLMILPPYKFNTVDGLITNFHVPKSTLLMLVSAFAGREQVLNAYKEALCRNYRFLSYGDAMLVI